MPPCPHGISTHVRRKSVLGNTIYPYLETYDRSSGAAVQSSARGVPLCPAPRSRSGAASRAKTKRGNRAGSARSSPPPSQLSLVSVITQKNK